MSDNIKNFRLSDVEESQGYNRILLQLFGLIGNGKSSFINSCKFVLDGGAFFAHAEVADSLGSKTTKRISYELTESICIVDNRGMPMLARFKTGEIFAQLGNLVPLNEEVDWVEDFNDNVDRIISESFKEDNLCDLIVPVFIHKVNCNIKHEAETYKTLLNTARDLTGIAPYVILTHKYHGGEESMRSLFTDMGINKIYTIENYTKENPRKVREKHEEITKFLNQVLEDIKFHIAHMEDPKEERERRLKFLIKYIKKSSDMKRDVSEEKPPKKERKKCFLS